MLAAWENKNAKRAMQGTGFTLMAVSLAACGGGSDDAANTAATAAAVALAAAKAATELAEAETLAANTALAAAKAATVLAEADTDTAEAAAEEAVAAKVLADNAATAATEAKVLAEDTAAAATLTANTATAAKTAAETAEAAAKALQLAAEADTAAANAVATAATADKDTAEAATEAANTALAAAEDARDVATAATDAANTAQAAAEDALAVQNKAITDAGFLNTADVLAKYAALTDGRSLEFTSSATADNLIGGVGDDTFTAAAGTVVAGDRATDVSTTDNDSLTIVHSTAPGAFTSANIEVIDITLNNLGALIVDTSNFSGVNNLTVTRGDVVVGGATLSGDKTVRVDYADASQVGAITVGAGTTTVDINSGAADLAGHVINADLATGAITVDGAATINAALSTDVQIDAVTNTAVAQTGKATLINAASATTVTTHANLTGAIEVNAAVATTLTVSDGQGGVTINAATAHTADSTITVVDVDSSGAIITVGTGVDDTATAANIGLDVTLDGTAATTDAATISGAGHIELAIAGTGAQGNVDVITLSGNGAAVVYDLAAPTTGTATSFTKAGTQSVEIMGDASEFSAVTVTNIDVIDIIGGGGANFDASLFSNVGKIDLGVAVGNFVATVVSGQTVEITFDQTTKTDFDFSSAGGGDLTVVAGDDNGVSAAVGTINLLNFNAAAGAATTAGTVTIEASISNVDATGVTLGAAQNLVITGDEDVNLSDIGGAETVIADSVNASGSSGIITINVIDGVAANTADVDSITTGSGNDLIGSIVGTGVVTVASNGGNDTITITQAGATSTFDGGDGNDTFNADEVAQVVMIGAKGADNFATAAALAGTIIGGDDSDTITIDAAGAVTFASTFAFSGIEELDITASNGVVSMTGAQLAANATLIIDGDAAADIFNVSTGSTAAVARSADLSNVTIKTGATAAITVTGGAGVDTITGGVASETFTQTIGADVYEGGAGTGVDTYVAVTNLTAAGSSNASVGSIVNLGTTAVTSADVIANATSFISGSATSVAGGTAAHLYAANVAGNSAEADILGGIENVTGTAQIDYVVGSVEANTISTLAGADYIDAGAGGDTVVGGDGIDTILLGLSDAAIDFVSYFGITAAINANNVTQFEVGVGGDVIQFSDLSLAVDAGAFTAGTAVTFSTVALKADTANEIIVDTIANLGALGVTIGDESTNTTNVHQIAIASDTGAIFYDADGDWTGLSVQIGDLDVTTGLTVDNVAIIA